MERKPQCNEATHLVHSTVQRFWTSLCESHRIPYALSTTWWQYIETAYSDAPRRYHTLTHLYELIQLHECVVHQLCEPSIVGFSLFFHDIVYNTMDAVHNEARSVERFRDFVSESSEGCLPPTLVTHVAQLIADTTHQQHSLQTETPNTIAHDMQLFLDMDLAILGAHPVRYAAYTREIRDEYQHLDTTQYVHGRSVFLQGMLSRSCVYRTAYFRDRFHEQAQVNMRCELAQLDDMANHQDKLTVAEG